MQSSKKGLRALSTELITMISSYLTEHEMDLACIALEPFFQCTTSVVYHVNAMTTLPKRNPSVGADFSEAHCQAVWELLRDPERAALLRSITLLRPISYWGSGTKRAWVEKDSHVDHVLETVRQNASEIRFFETSLDRPLKSLLQDLLKLAELKIPSTTSLQDVNLPSLRRLTIVHYITQAPAPLPSMVGLTHLEIQCFGTAQGAVPRFVDLNILPSLHTLRLTCESTYPGTSINPILFCGYSSSLRYVAASGPFLFRNFMTLKRWLRHISSETLHSLSLSGIKFGYNPHDVQPSLDSETWPSMPQLRSLELLGGIDPVYFQALPCFGLRKLFVATKHPLQSDDALILLLEIASLSLEVVSIIEHQFPRLNYSKQNYHVFSADFVKGLAHCRELRHFESVGSYIFKKEDWAYLCARTFLYLDQVHVESLHLKRFDRPDNIDALCAPNANHSSPPQLQELYNGRMFVSSSLASQWVHRDLEATTVMGNAKYRDDHSRITQFLSQQFRRQADAEGDLHFIHNPIISPRHSTRGT